MKSDVKNLVESINSTFKNVVVRSAVDIPNVRKVPLGQPALDYIMGGGVPINRIIEFYGPYSAFKSYMSYLAIAKFQRYDFNNMLPDGIKKVEYEEQEIKVKTESDGTVTQTVYVPKKVVGVKGMKNPESRVCALIDYEAAYDPAWGEFLGIDNKGLLHLIPERGSQVVDMLEALLMNPAIGLIVLDSVGAASSDLEIDASAEDEQMGVNARFWNKAMRKFQAAMNSNPDDCVTLLMINRPYAKLGMVFGSPEEVGGGSGIRFGKSVSVRFTPLKELTDKEGNVQGRNVKVKCMKSKVSQPFREAEFYFSFMDTELFDKNYPDVVGQLISVALRTGVVTRSGAFYSYNGKKVQGRDNFALSLEEDGLIDKLMEEVYNEL